MRLYTFFTLCACALYTRAASVPAVTNKFDALDNVDLDNTEPELVDQSSIQDVDNSLRKVSEIAVKVIDSPVVVNENSNDYIPDKDENINIKRVEIDVNNPGLPQRQEHDNQNPVNYEEKERAVYEVLQKTQEAQSVFSKGIKALSDSFDHLSQHNNDIPIVLENIKNLDESFTNEISELNNVVKTSLKSVQEKQIAKESSKLKFVELKLKNLESNFKHGVGILSEGIELLAIFQEEDEAAKSQVKSLIKDEDEAVKDTASSSAPSSSTAAPSPLPVGGMQQFLSNFQNGISNMFSNITAAFQNNFSQQGSQPGNPIINFFQGISLPNIIQGSGNSPAATTSKPPDVQSDEAGSASAPAQTPSSPPPQWGPQVLFQQIQNSIQSIVNPGQANQQQAQPAQASSQPASGGPISQAFQNIVQFIQRPSQVLSPQPAKPSSETQNSPPKQPASSPAQADAIPQSASVPVIAPAPAVEVASPANPAVVPQTDSAQKAPSAAQEQPGQNRPLQQLVQNNPIIKGFQSAVQRIQGTAIVDTPRNEEVKDEKKENDNLENKGHGGQSSASNGYSNDSGRVNEQVEGQIPGKPIAVLADSEIESGIKPEEVKPLSIADKTE